MTWQSENYKGRWQELDDFYQTNYKFRKKNKMKWSIWRMRIYGVLVFVVAGITALKSAGVGWVDLTPLVGVLVLIENELKA